MFSKCANPKCLTGFDYHLGGKFYRFHQSEQAPRLERNTHAVVHFWLCPRCAQTYTLDFDGIHCLLIRSMGIEESEVGISANASLSRPEHWAIAENETVDAHTTMRRGREKGVAS